MFQFRNQYLFDGATFVKKSYIYIHIIWYIHIILLYVWAVWLIVGGLITWVADFLREAWARPLNIRPNVKDVEWWMNFGLVGWFNRRKFRSQTSDNMDRWKAEQGRGREKRKIRREKIRRERVRGQKIQMRRKGRKVAKHCVFPMICGSGGSKSRLAKAAGAEPAGQMRDEKLHAVVARSTFRSQKC